jgi:hypothetical protein
MADLTKQAFTNAGTAMTNQATVAGGDAIILGNARTLVVFRNGHASAITITMPPVTATSPQVGSGLAPVPTRSRVAAAGETAVFDLKPNEMGAYLDGTGRVNFTYTGHNPLLVASAVDIS